MPTKNFPLYLFLGEEDFLKEEAIEGLRSRFLDKSSRVLNYSVFYAKDRNFNIREMLETLNTLPILSKKRLIVLKDADSLPQALKKSILFYLRNPKESSVFIIESPSPFIKGEFLLEVSKLAQLFYYRRLLDSKLNAWLVKKADFSGKKILSEAIEAIKESLPNDLRMLSSNMDSIILYTGKRTVITKQDVEKLTGRSALHTAFDLIDTLGKKDAKRSLRIFSSLKKNKTKEVELLGLLAWNARMLLRAKEFLRIKGRIEIQRDLGLSSRRFDQIAQQAAGFKKGEVLSLLKEILRSDLDIKRGLPPKTVIEKLIVRMCS